MSLDLNVLPYFDDYNEDKGFHRVLFKPGVAVQARELTQLQTILQKQIERFGDHVFTNGARVLGGKFDPYDPIPYVRVNVVTSTQREALIGKELTGSVTGLKARVIHAEVDPEEAGVSVLYLAYTDQNNQTITTSFNNENLTYTDGTLTTITTIAANATGFGSVFGIGEGVLYVEGFFVKFNAQKIAIDPFTSSATKRVYFKATFSVVDSNGDTTLLDPSQGFNNFNAPGADRLKCELTLVTSDIDVDLRDESRFLLLEVRSGEIYERNERTVYNEIAEELAKRTHDESGDYVVRGWNVRTREHLNTTDNGGKYTLAEGGDENKIVVELEKGLAYVKGYEVETIQTRPIEVDKATAFEFIDEQYSFVKSGPYVIVDQLVGVPAPDSFVEVNLYDTAETRITSGIRYTVSPSGAVIGTARLVSYIEEAGQFGQSDAQVRFFIANVVMNSGKSFGDVKGIGNSDFFGDIVLDDLGNATIYDNAENTKLTYVGNPFTRSVKNIEGNSDFTLTFAKQTAGEITTGGAITGIVTLGTNESLIYGTQTLASLSKETLFLTVTEDASITLTGNTTTTASNTTVAGTGTQFNNLNVGDRIRINSANYLIASIESDTSLTLETAAAGNFTGPATKEYLAGDLIDLNSRGADDGAVRTVTTTATTISIDLHETFNAATACKLTYRVKREAVEEITKNIRANRFVLVDGSTATSLTQFYLGVPDVFNIRQVRKHTSAFVNITDGADVTSEFALFQNDNVSSYDTSYITTPSAIANTEHLLIEFDYYEADIAGGGYYFSIDSYPVNDTLTSNTTIKTVDLTDVQRNYLDFRAVHAASATPGTSIGTAPTNPAISTTFNLPAGGQRSPVPGTNIVFDYSYYLARRDVLAVKPNGEFKVFQGQPAIVPPYPKVSDSYMIIANLTIPPYPSLSENYAKILERQSEGVVTERLVNTRHTMRDIGAMKQRIKNLEYYTALSILEKDTMDLTVLDENGLDRFKNGVFVNPFVDHTLSDTANPEYNIAIDRKGKHIRPAYNVEGFDTNYSTGTNVVKTGALVHLPFSEKVLKEQLFATTTRNVELSSYRYIGDLNLYPDVDTWVDTTTVDKQIDFGNDVEEGKIVGVEWNSWATMSSGAVSGTEISEYKIYHRNAGDMKFDGNEKLLISFNNIEDVYSYILSANALQNAPGILDTGDITDPAVQRYLDRNTAVTGSNGKFKSRFFIVYGGKIATEETILEKRTGIETFMSAEDVNYDIGSFVTDVSLIPYIRPQTLKLYAYGLKPNTRFHVFFDGENMNDFTTPVTVDSYFNAPTVTNTGYRDYDTNLTNMGSEGAAVFSNAKGEVLAFLRLPSGVDKRFRTGDKDVIITDNPTNDPAATSFARSKFVSSGLNLQKQNTILSTRTLVEEKRTVTETRSKTVTRSDVRPQGWFEVGPSCAAYSFFVDEDESVEGVFLSSVDIWLSAIHPTLGIWFELREMSSDGGITRNTVPYSTVWMNRDDPRIRISTDGITNETKVNFDSPVFLYNNTQYAFVIHTEGLNPDTYFWVSSLGGTDVSSGNQVSSRAQFGTYYTTNNNLNWDIVPDVDLKVRFNRVSTGASVATPVSGTATFVIEDVEFITSNTAFSSTFFYDGEPVRGSEILTIAFDGANTIAIGDTIADGTSNTFAVVVDIDGTDIYTDGFDYIVGANVEIYDGANTASVKETGSISTVNFGMGIVDKIDTANKRFDIIHSNGKFFVDANLRSVLPNRHKSVLNGTDIAVTYTGAGSILPNPYAPTGTITMPVGLSPESSTLVPTHTIEGFARYEYSSSTFRPAFLNFEGDTSVSFSAVTTTGNTVNSAETYYANAGKEYNNVRNLLSRSEEVQLLAGAKSFRINVALTTNSDYVTPILDTTLVGNVFTSNQLNANTTGELGAFTGQLSSKYISKIIKLTDDNAAEDLLVQLQEYRPDTTDIKVYARIKSSYDTQDIRVKPWFEMSSSKTAVSSSVNKENYIDTTYQVPAERLTGDGEAIQYTLSGNLAVISGTEMVANTDYVIHSLGSTDFTDFGAANNVVGETFTATGPSNGTGTVSLASDVIYTRFTEFQIKIGMSGTNSAVYPKAAQLRAIALQR